MWVSGEARGSQEDLILHPGARLLLDTWLTLKGERAAPLRSDLDLRQMHRQAPWLFILEPVQGARTFTYRLVGTGLCGFLKQDMTGCDFLAGWERFERGAISQALAAVTTKQQPAHFRLRYLTDLEQRIGADMLALPMTARDGETVHVLGGLFPHGNPDIWSYERLAPADLAAVRLFGNKPEKIGVRPDVQAPRKFRLISGGLDLS
ncbi:PAS domain-containing protein [Aestuariivirga sp.]|uniref:PAS domain-containing protein n=1 Tax=Aestuariivirga sp. TaxID=2650926 RepID=UPI003019A2B1